MQTSKLRGNDICFDESVKRWRYTSDNSLTSEKYNNKPCIRCGQLPTTEGHDACLGTLIGVMNSCCGHGNKNDAYIQFLDGKCIHGEDAITIQNILKKANK